ncbi:histidine phosphatase family protein [Saccharopolyspora sp. TS4A08]|uniref:Histidine phosphatase family protein n=1 Tax=Saccharopolyspora ipomoeae TaxID=3042027 RepID=A0ABT6PVK8_9PSEU|nr:histidine phosphatase family protein [Saccharopolyspora sp. TS4A08]MDI2032043.1 histidine phosphatase family protein [Saccharopolyspora sp. TS4A08]
MSGFELSAPAGVRLVLARHGQTPANVAKLLDTLPPGPGLTELGRQQAEELAERLAERDDKIVGVHASHALRAQQTAEPVARRLGLPLQLVEGTHEVFVGELEGLGGPEVLAVFDEVYAAWHSHDLDVPMPGGGETGRDAITRFLAGARSALEGVSEGAVVMVSHGAMLRLVAGVLVEEITGAEADSLHLPNTGLIIIESDPATRTGWRCLGWDGLL